MSAKRSYQIKNKFELHDSNLLSIFYFFDFALKSMFDSKHIYKIVQKNNENLLLFEIQHWLTPYPSNYHSLNTDSPNFTNKTDTKIQKSEKSGKSTKISKNQKKLQISESFLTFQKIWPPCSRLKSFFEISFHGQGNQLFGKSFKNCIGISRF